MEDHLQSPLDKQDFPALAKSLTKAATLSPDPTWNTGAQAWSTLATTAADAAKQADLTATQAACKACHKVWRSKYKQTYRTRPVVE
jgi:hypothetical protein